MGRAVSWNPNVYIMFRYNSVIHSTFSNTIVLRQRNKIRFDILLQYFIQINIPVELTIYVYL